jgi:hypothetical protein
MAWKRTVLTDWDEGAIADADTAKIIKLPQALISAIHLRLSGTGGSGTPAVDALIATMKIKTDKGYVVDLRSADALKIARALYGTQPQVVNATGAYTAVNQSIMFGRKRRDPACLLNVTSSNVRQLELTFGTLIAATAWATTTVKLSVTIEEWIGAVPAQYKGFIGAKEVENKVTGTGKAVFDLYQGGKLAGIFINIGTITTVRQVTICDKKMTVIFGQVNFRDLVAEHNIEFNPDTVETLDALWVLWDRLDTLETQLPVLSMSDPCVIVERGTTTTTSRLVQLDLNS